MVKTIFPHERSAPVWALPRGARRAATLCGVLLALAVCLVLDIAIPVGLVFILAGSVLAMPFVVGVLIVWVLPGPPSADGEFAFGWSFLAGTALVIVGTLAVWAGAVA